VTCAALAPVERTWPSELDANEIAEDLSYACRKMARMVPVLDGTGYALEDCAALLAEDICWRRVIATDLISMPTRNARRAVLCNKLRWKVHQVRAENWRIVGDRRPLAVLDDIAADRNAGPELALIISDREAEAQRALDFANSKFILAMKLRGASDNEIVDAMRKIDPKVSPHGANMHKRVVREILEARLALLMDDGGQAAEALHRPTRWMSTKPWKYRTKKIRGDIAPATERRRKYKTKVARAKQSEATPPPEPAKKPPATTVDDMTDPRQLMEDVRSVVANLRKLDHSFAGTDTPAEDAAQNLLLRLLRNNGAQAEHINAATSRVQRRSILYNMIKMEMVSRFFGGSFNSHRVTLREFEDGDELEFCVSQHVGNGETPEDWLIEKEDRQTLDVKRARALEIAQAQPLLARRFGGARTIEVMAEIGKSRPRTSVMLKKEVDAVRAQLAREGFDVGPEPAAARRFWDDERPASIKGHRWMTSSEASELLGLGRNVIQHRTRRKRQYRREGWFYAIPESEIENAMRERASTAEAAE
jgi:hypothetical protein